MKKQKKISLCTLEAEIDALLDQIGISERQSNAHTNQHMHRFQKYYERQKKEMIQRPKSIIICYVISIILIILNIHVVTVLIGNLLCLSLYYLSVLRPLHQEKKWLDNDLEENKYVVDESQQIMEDTKDTKIEQREEGIEIAMELLLQKIPLVLALCTPEEQEVLADFHTFLSKKWETSEIEFW